MKEMLGFAQKASFHSIVFLAGLFLVFLSSFHVESLQKGQITAYGEPIYSIFIIGVALILCAMGAFGLTLYYARQSETIRIAARISKEADRIVAQIGESSITVVLGRLEMFVTDPSQVLVVLPANEYFSDRCINDSKSALGAFVQAKFPGKTREFESLVQLALREKPARSVQLGAKTLQAYGLGTTVFMDRPLNEAHRILLAAATTERQGEGLRGDVTALFIIVREANRVAKENRLSEVVLPMIGAGHGSICPDHALIVQLLAWSELLYSNPGQKLAVRIVIFRGDAMAKPEIGLKTIARLMAVATSSCAPCPQD
jgi:hypothetical protein